MRKSESSQSYDSRAQSADSSKACSKPRALTISNRWQIGYRHILPQSGNKLYFIAENGLLERDLLQCVIAKQAGRFEENANA